MKGEKEEKEIVQILMDSDLNFWETVGMLENIKTQMMWKAIKETDRNV